MRSVLICYDQRRDVALAEALAIVKDGQFAGRLLHACSKLGTAHGIQRLR